MKKYYVHSLGDYQVYQTPNLWKTHQNYNYILSLGEDAVIFDPGEFLPISHTIKKNKLKIKAIYLTHHHPDHIGAVEEFVKVWQCPVYGFLHDRDRLPEVTHFFEEGDTLQILDLKAQVLFVPGHTLGLCAFNFPEKNWLFSSDLLFSFGCGRVFEGTYKQMFESLKQIITLPKDTLIFSSHEYTLANIKFTQSLLKDDPLLKNIYTLIKENIEDEIPSVPTSLDFELEFNPFLKWQDQNIRKSLALLEATDLEVFTKIRELKNNFK
jgi:hydroxyacylglutathione hydrolase